jgi:GxxExxY protein
MSKPPLNIEELSSIVVDCSYKIHVEIGPGLLESMYEIVLAKMLEDRGLKVQRQFPISIHLMGMHFEEGFRADLIVEQSLLVVTGTVNGSFKAGAHLFTFVEITSLLAD